MVPVYLAVLALVEEEEQQFSASITANGMMLSLQEAEVDREEAVGHSRALYLLEMSSLMTVARVIVVAVEAVVLTAGSHLVEVVDVRRVSAANTKAQRRAKITTAAGVEVADGSEAEEATIAEAEEGLPILHPLSTHYLQPLDLHHFLRTLVSLHSE